MGIEPTYPAWKAGVLPLNYTRVTLTIIFTTLLFVNHNFIFILIFLYRYPRFCIHNYDLITLSFAPFQPFQMHNKKTDQQKSTGNPDGTDSVFFGTITSYSGPHRK